MFCPNQDSSRQAIVTGIAILVILNPVDFPSKSGLEPTGDCDVLTSCFVSAGALQRVQIRTRADRRL